jgi:hypothetical protein
MNQHKLMNLMRFTMILCLTLAVGILRGQTQFIGPANGDWFTAANWNNGLPAVGNDANISGDASVVIGAPLTVNFQITSFGSVTNNSTLTVTNTLTSGGSFTNTGIIDVSAGATLTSSGGMTNSGTINNKGVVNSNSPFTNSATGVVNNENNFQQGAAFTNNGIVSNKAGNFTCPQAFTNNKTVENIGAATFTVDFGGTFTNAAGSSLTNSGTFRNFASFINNTTVTNTGQYLNAAGTHTCNGVFNNENGGRFESGATVNLSGRWNNKVGSTTLSNNIFNVVANGVFDNLATFQNNNIIDVKATGLFNNQNGALLNLNFGSKLDNAGDVKTFGTSKIVSNGEINNNSAFANGGIIESGSGAKINNASTLTNTGTIKSSSIISNTGTFSNSSALEIQSGGVFTNSATFTNNVSGVVTNGFEIYNVAGATFLNNGAVRNNIRFFNESTTLTNNGYFATAGDVFNRAGATFTNTEVFEILEGSVTNEGTLDNRKNIFLRKCGIISNKATISNASVISSEGIILQRGTLTGNAVAKITGLIVTDAGSDIATGLCKPTFRSGTDISGRAKVDAAQVLLPTIGVDSCFGIQYFINGLNRSTYLCADIGRTIPSRLKLILRTGDSLTCNTSIEVFDGVAPIITNCPQDLTVLTLTDNAVVTWPTLAATDNCGTAVTFTATNASGSTFNLGTTKVTLSAKDVQNNNEDCIFNVTVKKLTGVTATCPTTDNTAPVFANCPANIVLNVVGFNAAATWTTPSVSDNCYPISVRSTSVSGSTFQKGATTVTYTATDSKGNVGNCTFTVTVNGGDPCTVDNVKPTIFNCPSNIFVSNNPANNSAVALWKEPTTSDNCFGAVLTSTAFSGNLFANNTTTPVVYTSRDGAGNTSTCTFNVEVGTTDPCAGDVTGPVFAGCPADLTVNTTTLTGTATWTAPTATDNCGGVSINASQEPGTNFPLGVNTVTYQASDRKGNRSFCTFKVTVNNACLSDSIKPVLSACPANITVASSNGQNAAASWTAPTATDNCSAATVTSDFTSGSLFPIGATTVIYTATDLNGNNAKCTFTVTVTNVVVPPIVTEDEACIAARAAGSWNREYWTYTFNNTYPTPVIVPTTAPNSKTVLTSGQGSINIGDYYITRMRGYIRPTVSGAYTFYITGDDYSDLYFTTAGVSAAAKTRIAFIQGWTLNDEVNKYPSQKSVSINLVAGRNYYIEAVQQEYAGGDNVAVYWTTPSNATPTIIPGANLVPFDGTCAATCSGGLRASYFNNITLTGAPALVRTDATVNFDWAVGSPATAITVDNFSARWEGQIEAPVSGAFTFTTTSDDGIRLFIDNQLIIDKFFDQSPTDWTGSVTLSAGKHDIKIEYYERGGGAVAKLSWEYPGQAKQIVPSSRLCSTVVPTCVVSLDPNKCYRLVNKGSGKALDVKEARQGNGAVVIQYDYLNQSNQQWAFKPTSGGFYTITSRQTGQALDCQATATGSQVVIWANTPATSREWKVECNSDGSYRLTNRLSNKVLEIEGASNANAALAKIGDYSNVAHENWAIEAVACAPVGFCVNNGNIIVDRWTNHTANNFPLVVPTTYPNVSIKQGNTQGPWNIGDNYFTRVRGYIRPQASGAYSFNLTGDDNTELFLSTTSEQNKIRRITYIQGWTSETEYNKYPTQTATNIQLVAGQLYYFELRHKEFGGGDGWRISWKTPSNQTWTPIQSQFLASGCNDFFQPLAIKNQFAFEAKADVNQAKLSWLSNGGLKNDYFVVERSSATSDFESIQVVNAKTAAADLKDYTFVDANPVEGDNFYRIKTVQMNGDVSISDIKTLTFGKVQDVRIFPNPASDFIDVDLKVYEGKQVNIFMYNAMGKLINTTNVESATSAPQHIEIDNLTAGPYLIRIQVEGKRDVIKQVQITN